MTNLSPDLTQTLIPILSRTLPPITPTLWGALGRQGQGQSCDT